MDEKNINAPLLKQELSCFFKLNNQENISGLQKEYNIVINDLLEKHIIKQKLTQEYISKEIESYLNENRAELLEFLGESGKVLVVMNSAEKFADMVIENLGINKERIVKTGVQTYKDGKSNLKELSQNTKNELSTGLLLNKGNQKLLILEDMIDTGNTLNILTKFIKKNSNKSKTLCLFDKNMPESESVKAELKENLQSIINIGNKFIVGSGIDYSHRLLSGLDGLYEVENPVDFFKIINPIRDKIIKIL